EKFRCRHAERCLGWAKHSATNDARSFRRVESSREPLARAALPQTVANARLPPLAQFVRNELDVERVAQRAEPERREHWSEKPRETGAVLVDRSLKEKPERDREPRRRTDRRDSQDAMTGWLNIGARERLGFVAFAACDLECGTQIGERMPCAKLSAGL